MSILWKWFKIPVLRTRGWWFNKCVILVSFHNINAWKFCTYFRFIWRHGISYSDKTFHRHLYHVWIFRSRGCLEWIIMQFFVKLLSILFTYIHTFIFMISLYLCIWLHHFLFALFNLTVFYFYRVPLYSLFPWTQFWFCLPGFWNFKIQSRQISWHV